MSYDKNQYGPHPSMGKRATVAAGPATNEFGQVQTPAGQKLYDKLMNMKSLTTKQSNQLDRMHRHYGDPSEMRDTEMGFD